MNALVVCKARVERKGFAVRKISQVLVVVSFFLPSATSSSRADEPVSAVWDTSSPSLSAFKARLLRDELLSVLSRQHVIKFTIEELRERLDKAEIAWEDQRQQATVQNRTSVRLPTGELVARPLNPLGTRTVGPGNNRGDKSAIPPEATPSVDPLEQFQGIFREFAQQLPGQPQLLPAKVAQIEQQFAANAYVGLGVNLSRDDEGKVVFPRIIPGGAAERAGLKNGVEVLAVDGWSTRDQQVNDIVDRIRGPIGSVVTLRIKQDDSIRELPIRRDVVRFDSFTDVENRPIREAQWPHPADARIAFVRFQRLVSSTVHELRQMEVDLRRQKCQALVFDFRQLHLTGDWRNLQLVADALIAGGVLWEEVTQDGSVTMVRADADCLFRDLPLVVITTRHNSGQVEALARVLQQSGRAMLVQEDSEIVGTVLLSETKPVSARNNVTPDPVLGYPLDSVPLGNGRWVLSVPKRCWRIAADSQHTSGAVYTLRQKRVIDSPEAVTKNGSKVRGDPVYRLNSIIDPPIPNTPEVGPHDAVNIAVSLAKAALKPSKTP